MPILLPYKTPYLVGYEQNQDFFTLLLDNEEKKRELMQVFLEDIYNNLREEPEKSLGNAAETDNPYLTDQMK